MYNVPLRRVRATIIEVEYHLVLHSFECVFVALGDQHAIRMRHTAICVLSASTVFFHIIT
jgi:hypothetical protein